MNNFSFPLATPQNQGFLNRPSFQNINSEQKVMILKNQDQQVTLGSQILRETHISKTAKSRQKRSQAQFDQFKKQMMKDNSLNFQIGQQNKDISNIPKNSYINTPQNNMFSNGSKMFKNQRLSIPYSNQIQKNNSAQDLMDESIQYQHSIQQSRRGDLTQDNVQQPKSFIVLKKIEPTLEQDELQNNTQFTFKNRHQSMQQQLQYLDPPDNTQSTPQHSVIFKSQRNYITPFNNNKIFEFPQEYLQTKQWNMVHSKINSTLDYKSQQLQDIIGKAKDIHFQLMLKKEVSKNISSQFEQIESCLQPKLRENVLTNNKSHLWILSSMNILNKIFMETIDFTSSYRVELGQVLQTILESYNSIYIQQFETFYHYKLKKEKECDLKIQEAGKEQEKWQQMQDQLEQTKSLIMEVVQSKDNEILRLQNNQKELDEHIVQLNQIIAKDRKDTQNLQDKLKKVQDEPTKVDGLQMRDGYEKDKLYQLNIDKFEKNYDLLYQQENIPEFQTSFKRLLKDQQSKQNVLEQLKIVVKQFSMNNSQSKYCQTEQAIWNEQIQQQAYEYLNQDGQNSDYQPRLKYIDDSDDSEVKEQMHIEKMQKKYSQKIIKRGIELQEQPSEIDIQEKNAQRLFKSRSTKVIKIFDEDRQSEQNKFQNSVNTPENKLQLNLQAKFSNQIPLQYDHNQDFDLQDPPQKFYNKTLRQNGLQNRQQLKYIHDSFIEIIEKIKKLKQNSMQARNDNLNRNIRWCIPFTIITFCANHINELMQNESQQEQFNIMPWKEMKKLIFDIYDHRLANSHEINGSANMNYCALNEYILIYFIDLYRDRKLAETQIVNMFICLRYYYDLQTRAKTFCQNLEILFFKSKHQDKFKEIAPDSKTSETDEYGDQKIDHLSKPPHSLYGDTVCPDNDLYAQEFFLHAYSLFSQVKEDFVESVEGYTYIKLFDVNSLSKRIVGSMRGPCGDVVRWFGKTRAMAKIITIGLDDFQFVDLDLLIYQLLNEFKNQRGAFQKSLENEYMLMFEKHQSATLVTFEQFNQLIQKVNMGDVDSADPYFDPLIQFPGEISKVRAFIFSLTAGQNNNSAFNCDNFLAGITRFGVESPTPCVSMRCQLYGNTKTILDQLKKAEKEYGKLKLKIHTKRYTLGSEFKGRSAITRIIGDVAAQDFHRKLLLMDIADEKPKIEANETLRPQNFVHTEQNQQYNDMKRQIVENEEVNSQRNTLNKKKKKGELDATIINSGIKIRLQNLKQFGNLYQLELIKKLQHQKLKTDNFEEVEILEKQIQNLQNQINNELEFINSDGNENPEYNNDDEDQKEFINNLKELNQKQKKELTQIIYTSAHRQIIVPSVSTVSNIFNQHLKQLSDLKLNMNLLQQAYIQQMDSKLSWDYVDKILILLSDACQKLNFPSGHELNLYKVENKDQETERLMQVQEQQISQQIELMKKKQREILLERKKKGYKGKDINELQERENQINEVESNLGSSQQSSRQNNQN